MQYLDPLYGQITIAPTQLALFQTQALTRLREISLSAVPPIAVPFGMIASRFEHSVGVAHLANLLTQHKSFQGIGPNLYLASLFHDAGSPPFSHVSELFLKDLLGRYHEEYVETVLDQKEVKSAIKIYGGDTKIILKLITGTFKPWSDLINGSIDLDNIDNSLRWSLGAGLLRTPLYEPEELIKAYVFKDHHLYLHQDYYSEILKWELCRRLTYDLVNSDNNLAPGSMLVRALQFAYDEGELKEDFFRLTESQALYVLENRCNPKTQMLVTQIRTWRFYQLAASKSSTGKISSAFKKLCQNFKLRKTLANKIAQALNIPPEKVAVYAGIDKGFKQIHLPFIGSEVTKKHIPTQKLNWHVKAYLHPSLHKRHQFVQPIVDEWTR